MIRFANQNDVKKIVELWDIAFPEDADFNSYFFKNIFDVKKTLIMEENGELLSMLQMLPYKIKGIGDVTYIYGAATHPKYRGKGYMRTLLEHSFEIDRQNGYAGSILIPASDSLYDYYVGIGYKTAFYISKKKFNKTNTLRYDFKKAEYSDIPDIISLYKGDIERDFDYFKIQIDMFRALGGEVFLLYDGSKPLSYAFTWCSKDIEIQELGAACESCQMYMAEHIMSYYGKASAKATTLGGDIHIGMIKYYGDEKSLDMSLNLMYN